MATTTGAVRTRAEGKLLDRTVVIIGDSSDRSLFARGPALGQRNRGLSQHAAKPRKQPLGVPEVVRLRRYGTARAISHL